MSFFRLKSLVVALALGVLAIFGLALLAPVQPAQAQEPDDPEWTGAGISITNISAYAWYPMVQDNSFFQEATAYLNQGSFILRSRNDIGYGGIGNHGACIDFRIEEGYAYSGLMFVFSIANVNENYDGYMKIGLSEDGLPNDNRWLFYEDAAGPGIFDLAPPVNHPLFGDPVFPEGTNVSVSDYNWYAGDYRFCLRAYSGPLDRPSFGLVIQGREPAPQIQEISGQRLENSPVFGSFHKFFTETTPYGPSGVWRQGYNGNGAAYQGSISFTLATSASNIIAAWAPLREDDPEGESIEFELVPPGGGVLTSVNVALNEQYVQINKTLSPGTYELKAQSGSVFLVRNFRLYANATPMAMDLCTTVQDSSFTYPYDTLYPTPQSTSQNNYLWNYPAGLPGETIFYAPPITLTTFRIYSDTPAISAQINDVWGPRGTYTVTLNARAVVTGATGALYLDIGLADSLDTVGHLNHTQLNIAPALLETQFTYTTTPITISQDFQPYTITLENRTLSGADPPFLTLMGTELDRDGLSQPQAYIEIDQICVYGEGQPLGTCQTLPDPTFAKGEWQATGNALINADGLTLYPGGYAYPRNGITATLDYNQPYLLYVDAVTGTGSMGLGLFQNDGAVLSTTLAISGSGVFSKNLGYLPYFDQVYFIGLTDTITTGLTIDYACIIPLGEGSQGDCLGLVPDPNFETGQGWTFYQGATHNPYGQNAWIPSLTGTYNSGDLAWVGLPIEYDCDVFSCALSGGLLDSLPELNEGEYLIAQFIGKSLGFTPAYMDLVLYDNVDQSYFPSTLGQDYNRYQIDVSAWAGKQPGLKFFNSTNEYAERQDAYLDSVCFFVSQTPAIPSSPIIDEYVPALTLNCANIASWLYNVTGINFPYLETIVNDGVAIWDFEQWVPWLAAQLWVSAAKPIICFLLAFFHYGLGGDLLNLIEWIPENMLAVVVWSLGPMGLIFRWFEFFGVTFLDQLDWLVRAYLKAFDLGWAMGQWIPKSQTEAIIRILNFLILAWNQLLPSISQSLSELLGTMIGIIWNDMIIPGINILLNWHHFIVPLIRPLPFVGPILAALLQLFVEGSKIGLALLQAPITFYNAFNAAINAPGFQVAPVCNGDALDPSCLFLAGVQLFGMATDSYFGYPIAITLVILGTITFFWRNVWPLLQNAFRQW